MQAMKMQISTGETPKALRMYTTIHMQGMRRSVVVVVGGGDVHMHGILLGRVNVLFAAAPQASGVKEAAARSKKLQVWLGVIGSLNSKTLKRPRSDPSPC